MPYGSVGEAPRTRSGRREGLFSWATEVTLDGTNPTPVSTPLREIKYAVACLKKSTADDEGAANVQNVSVDYGGAVAAGTVNVYAWGLETHAATGNGEVASTNSARVVVVMVLGVY